MSFDIEHPPTFGTLQKVDCESLNTLIQQYDEALDENTSKRNQYEKFKTDYIQLKTRLKSLPQKLEYDAMVPICSKALCPGKIIHTNEIFCLLGDNWFVECTAKKASEIVSHRLKSIDDTLNRLDKERDLYNSWKIEAERQMVETLGGGTIEIVEEYDEEREIEWKIRHRESVRQHHQKLAKERQKNVDVEAVNNKGKTEQEEKLWTRLDALELEEEFMEAQALYEEKISGVVSGQTQETKYPAKIRDKSQLHLLDILQQSGASKEQNDDSNLNASSGKKVTFSPDNIIHNLSNLNIRETKKRSKAETSDANSDNKEEIELYKPSEMSENGLFDPIFIRFRHETILPDSPDKDDLVDSDSDSNEDDENYQEVQSPGDIYNNFGPPSREAKTINVPGADKLPLKSILKPKILSSSTKNDNNSSNLSRKEVRITTNNTKTKLEKDKRPEDNALASKVTERVPKSPNDMMCAMSAMFPYMTPPSPSQENQNHHVVPNVKPVSLFKKSRQGGVILPEDANN